MARLVRRFRVAALARVAGPGAPVLVVRGAESEVLPAAEAARPVAALPDGRLVEIPDDRHDLTVEQPAALAEAVDRFLA